MLSSWPVGSTVTSEPRRVEPLDSFDGAYIICNLPPQPSHHQRSPWIVSRPPQKAVAKAIVQTYGVRRKRHPCHHRHGALDQTTSMMLHIPPWRTRVMSLSFACRVLFPFPFPSSAQDSQTSAPAVGALLRWTSATRKVMCWLESTGMSCHILPCLFSL